MLCVQATACARIFVGKHSACLQMLVAVCLQHVWLVPFAETANISESPAAVMLLWLVETPLRTLGNACTLPADAVDEPHQGQH